MKKQTFIVEIEMPDGDIVSPGWLQDLIQQDCDNEQNNGRQTVSVRDAQLPSNLDEAAEEYAYRGIPDIMKPTVKLLADEITKNFKSGAEWMAVQGETHETEIVSRINARGLLPAVTCLVDNSYKEGDKVVVQIRKK